MYITSKIFEIKPRSPSGYINALETCGWRFNPWMGANPFFFFWTKTDVVFIESVNRWHNWIVNLICSRLSILIVKKKRNFGAFLALKEFWFRPYQYNCWRLVFICDDIIMMECITLELKYLIKLLLVIRLKICAWNIKGA